MTLSQLIEKLQAEAKKHGADLRVVLSEAGDNDLFAGEDEPDVTVTQERDGSLLCRIY